MDLPQPLHPGMVDDLPLGDLARGSPAPELNGCSRGRVVAEAFAVEIGHGAGYDSLVRLAQDNATHWSDVLMPFADRTGSRGTARFATVPQFDNDSR